MILNAGTRDARTTIGRIAALLVTLLATACTPSVARNPFDAPAPGTVPVRAEIDNGLTQDVGVYAVQGSSKFRVGTVTSLSRTTLTIPASLIGASQELRLRAEPLGSRTPYTTQALLISAGSRIEWTIVPGLQASQAFVRY